MTIAIAGCGFIGRIYGQVIQELGEDVAAVVDPDEERRLVLARHLGCEPYSDLTEMLAAESSVGVIGLATPTHLHAEQTLEALRAGKSVLCEKPLAPALDDVAIMAEAATRTGSKLAVGFKMRFEGLFTTIRGLLLQGAIGEPRRILISHHQPLPPQTWVLRDGVTSELLIHSLDLANWLHGAEPVQVSSSHSEWDAGIEVATSFRLEYPSGRDAHIVGGWLSEGYPPLGGRNDFLVQIVGSRGHLIGLRPDTVLVCAGAETQRIGLPPYPYSLPFRHEWASFLRWVRGGEAGDLATARDGLAVHTVLDALHRSSANGRADQRPGTGVSERTRARHDGPSELTQRRVRKGGTGDA